MVCQYGDVEGMQMQMVLETLTQNTETYDIIKDGAATAIYGSKLIKVITTKKGKRSVSY
jgi:hypothetical protein